MHVESVVAWEGVSQPQSIPQSNAKVQESNITGSVDSGNLLQFAVSEFQ